MKKYALFLFAAIMTAFTFIFFSGCGTSFDGISEIRRGYYYAEDDTFAVTAVSGVREAPFTRDGVAGELKPYTLITVTPSAFDIDAVYTYAVTSGERRFGGTLKIHPFASSYSAEIDCELTDTFGLEIESNNGKRAYSLTSAVTENTVTFDTALNIARSEIKPDGEYETRVRLIKDPISGSGLCWHVEFCYGDGKDSGVLLDAETAKTIAIKK